MTMLSPSIFGNRIVAWQLTENKIRTRVAVRFLMVVKLIAIRKITKIRMVAQASACALFPSSVRLLREYQIRQVIPRSHQTRCSEFSHYASSVSRSGSCREKERHTG